MDLVHDKIDDMKAHGFYGRDIDSEKIENEIADEIKDEVCPICKK